VKKLRLQYTRKTKHLIFLNICFHSIIPMIFNANKTNMNNKKQTWIRKTNKHTGGVHLNGSVAFFVIAYCCEWSLNLDKPISETTQWRARVSELSWRNKTFLAAKSLQLCICFVLFCFCFVLLLFVLRLFVSKCLYRCTIPCLCKWIIPRQISFKNPILIETEGTFCFK